MIYSVMTGFNVAVSLMLAVAVFTLLQIKVHKIKERDIKRKAEIALQERAAQIQPGEVYRFIVKGNPLEQDKHIDYIVREVKDGYVGFVHANYPEGKIQVEKGAEFLERRTKVK